MRYHRVDTFELILELASKSCNVPGVCYTPKRQKMTTEYFLDHYLKLTLKRGEEKKLASTEFRCCALYLLPGEPTPSLPRVRRKLLEHRKRVEIACPYNVLDLPKWYPGSPGTDLPGDCYVYVWYLPRCMERRVSEEDERNQRFSERSRTLSVSSLQPHDTPYHYAFWRTQRVASDSSTQSSESPSPRRSNDALGQAFGPHMSSPRPRRNNPSDSSSHLQSPSSPLPKTTQKSFDSDNISTDGLGMRLIEELSDS